MYLWFRWFLGKCLPIQIKIPLEVNCLILLSYLPAGMRKLCCNTLLRKASTVSPLVISSGNLPCWRSSNLTSLLFISASFSGLDWARKNPRWGICLTVDGQRTKLNLLCMTLFFANQTIYRLLHYPCLIEVSEHKPLASFVQESFGVIGSQSTFSCWLMGFSMRLCGMIVFIAIRKLLKEPPMDVAGETLRMSCWQI